MAATRYSNGSRDGELRAALSRRQFVKLAALVGGSSALVTLLEACGSTGSATVTKTTASSSAGKASTTTASVSSNSSPSAVGSTTSTNIKLASDQTLRYVDTEPQYMDPGLTTSLDDLQIIWNVWEGLLDFDAQGKPVPLGATHWDISSDGTVYTFHLRDGVKWTDGTPITAHDYEWAWKRNEDPKTGSTYAQALYSVKGAQAYNEGKGSADAMGVKALDDKTLQVTLEGPAGYFLHIANTWTAFPLPRQSIEKYGAKWTDPPNAISNGPFKLTKWDHDQQIVLEWNDDYWGAKPTLQKVVVTLSTDVAKTSLPAYENNEFDYSIGPWPADIDRIEKDATLSKQLHIFDISSTRYVECDLTNTASPVSKLDFRHALYLAVDRERLAKDVFKIYKPAYTILPDDIPGHNPSARIEGTVEDAQKLLAKAGYPGGKGVSLTMAYSESTEVDLLAQALQEMWKQNLGISIQLNQMAEKAYAAYDDSLRADKSKHYDLRIGGWASDYLDPYDWLNFVFEPQADYLIVHWANAQYDALVKKAAILTDQAQRDPLYAQAEAILLQDMPVVPLYHLTKPYLIKSWVVDYIHNGIGFDVFKTTKVAQH